MLLYLLMEAAEGEAGPLAEACGRFWKLRPHDLKDSADGDELEFTCISYTWGQGREPSPFHPEFKVSDRTLPALETFIRHRSACKRIWIDAFCVPLEAHERASTLEFMGYIYSKAQEVVVVLSGAAFPVIESMTASSTTAIQLDEAQLSVLEKEEWVSRAWTYQEAVNARALHITCDSENAFNTIVDGSHFLNCVGYSLSRMEGSAFEKRDRFPRLDAFEDLIADYFISGYEERSALRVMSSMDGRVQSRPEDHFYAMMGAISAAGPSSAGASEADPCEVFMTLCERKGDYSFIYSGALREEALGRRWRPVVGASPSILPWHGWGSSQPGQADEDVLRLDGIIELRSGQLDEEAREYITQWLANLGFPTRSISWQQLYQYSFETLRRMGFLGSSKFIDTSSGIFFPFEEVDSQHLSSVLVTTKLRWVFGAPGLACYERKGGHGTYYTPGVFIGTVDSTAAHSVRLR
ncbi:hypothetical protein V8E54_001061 [Elaphomyces granulatus]